jgi:S-formylglutathione hydrolase FrmB
MKKIFLIALLQLALAVAASASVDTIQVYSNSMFKNVKCMVITPWNYTSTATRYPVVYLLHGYSGNYADWVNKVAGMQKLADDNNFLIVCPDGAFSSWYFDSPVDFTMRFETNVATEIPTYIDANYRTIASRSARAITGLSMGGHGGLFLGMRHANFFGACGSMSGALDVSRLRSYDLNKVLGDTIANAKYYKDWAVVNLIDNYPTDTLAMIIDCGTEDFLIEDNRKAHQKLLARNIPHDYTERPGGHTWEYWDNAVTYQMYYFRKFFNKTVR